jgi:hypothetical protein
VQPRITHSGAVLSFLNSSATYRIVIDAEPRPEGLQKDGGILASTRPENRVNMARFQAMSAIYRMAPGQIIAIYASCPELHVMQDYTPIPTVLWPA